MLSVKYELAPAVAVDTGMQDDDELRTRLAGLQDNLKGN